MGMNIRNIFYKEWLKTRWFVYASLVLGVCTILYAFISLNSNIINAGGASQYVNNWFAGQGGVRPHYLIFKNIPFLVAVLIGASQFIPEVLNKRIKLTLHLPVRDTQVLYSMVLYGFLAILGIMVVCMGIFFSLDAYFLSREMHIMALNAFLPWMLGAFTTYFFVAMIAMEPTWKFRLVFLIFIYMLIDIFKPESGYILMTGIMIVASLGMLYTAARFKIGEN